MTKRPIKIDQLSTVVCDDIRREINGKEFLIGVYSGKIIVNSFPARLSIALWINGKIYGEGKEPFLLKLHATNGSEAEIEGSVDLDDGSDIFSLSVPAVPIEFESAGKFEASIKIGQLRTKKLVSKVVELKKG